MAEFRRDPLVHRWVVTGFAQNEKVEDPTTVLQRSKNQDACCFCEGREHLTPTETYSIRKVGSLPNGPGWEIRVIPNRATDLRMVEPQKRGLGTIYDLQNGCGVHETIIETPTHLNRFSHLSVPQITNIFKTFQQRNGEHKKNHPLKGLLIFRNQGKESEHGHSQIVALPLVPKTILDELFGAKRYYDLKMRCIFCDMISEERKMNLRVVLESDHYFAWCPFAARFSFEVWIIAKQHQSEFINADSNTFSDLSQLLKRVLTQIEKILGEVPISFVLHTAPLRYDSVEESSPSSLAYHWHIEILPQTLSVGGFEWGSDFFLSSLTPENCARWINSSKLS